MKLLLKKGEVITILNYVINSHAIEASGGNVGHAKSKVVIITAVS
jgi:hypothetical protein